MEEEIVKCFENLTERFALHLLNDMKSGSWYGTVYARKLSLE